jgi:hypothetical protein
VTLRPHSRIATRSNRPLARTEPPSSQAHRHPSISAGGLEEQVTTAILHAAFIPFGPIKDVDIPLDHQTQKNRGFGFVTFEETCGRPESTQPYVNQSNQSFGKIFWQPSTSSSHIPPVHP